jgi:hypothetical protein
VCYPPLKVGRLFGWALAWLFFGARTPPNYIAQRAPLACARACLSLALARIAGPGPDGSALESPYFTRAFRARSRAPHRRTILGARAAEPPFS